MSWMFPTIDRVAFHDKAWKRADLAVFDERWARLSVPARKQYLTQVRAAGSLHAAQRPFNKAKSFNLSHIQDWGNAGLIRMEKSASSEDFVVADAAIGFTARLRALPRFHLLDATRGNLEGYIHNCFSVYSLAEVIDKIIHKETGLRRMTAADVYKMFVQRRRWPGWVASYLNDPLAEPLLAVIEANGGRMPLARLAERLPQYPAAEVRQTVDRLVNHLALFEDLDPQTFDILIGMLPAVIEDRRRAQAPRQSSLEPSDPVEAGPEAGVLVPDLRLLLLEVAGQPPRLKQDHSLFQKEENRFDALLEPCPAWLDAGDSRHRVQRALYLGSQVNFTSPGLDHGGALVLDLTAEGRRWLALSPEAQFAELYRIFRTREAQTPWLGNSDPFFLGSSTTAVPANQASQPAREAHWYKPLPLADRQPLRDAIESVFAELPVGTFFSVEEFLKYASTGPRNPLLLGGQIGSVVVQHDSRQVPSLEEHLEETANNLLRTLLLGRLAPLGAVQLGRDGQGQLLFASRPRLDVYFGRVEVAEESPAAAQTRVVVQPDFSVIVIGLNPAPVAELAPFCERVRGRASAGSLTLRITRDSVIKALAGGLPPDQVLARLEKHASTPLPKNVATEVRGWCAWVRTIAPSSATLLRCPDSATADRVMGVLGKHGERLGETVVAITLNGLDSAMRQKLQNHGILLESGRQRKPKKGR
jgi:hypothetical protein